jgi:hypothetical protein
MGSWTEVIVRPAQGGNALLSDGTGEGTMGTFACSKFGAARPQVGAMYSIQAREDGSQFPMDWEAKCTFSGETSEFQG